MAVFGACVEVAGAVACGVAGGEAAAAEAAAGGAGGWGGGGFRGGGGGGGGFRVGGGGGARVSAPQFRSNAGNVARPGFGSSPSFTRPNISRQNIAPRNINNAVPRTGAVNRAIQSPGTA